MKQPIVKGHPLHAIATDLPAGGFAASYLFDLLSRLAPAPVRAVGRGHVYPGQPAGKWPFGWSTVLRDTATYTFAVGWAGGALAGALGWWDFLNMPNDHPAKRPALLHGLLNSGLLVLGGLNLLSRSKQSRRGGTTGVPFALSTLGLLVLVGSAWLGGDLVYRLGWRVKPAEELELVEAELRKKGEGDITDKARQQVKEFERDSALLA